MKTRFQGRLPTYFHRARNVFWSVRLLDPGLICRHSPRGKLVKAQDLLLGGDLVGVESYTGFGYKREAAR